MSFLAGLLFSITTYAQDLNQNRERIDHLVHELELRSHVQTVLVTEHAPANLTETRRLMIELGNATESTIDLKSGMGNQIKYGLKEVPHEIRVVGRELGPGVMILYVGVEIFDWLGPVFFTAIGQPGVAAVIVAIPETAVLIPLMIAGREIAYQKKENRVYGGRKTRVILENLRQEKLENQGIRSLEHDKYFGGVVLSNKNNKKNPDALNFKRVKKYLKKNGYWNESVAQLSKDAKWTKAEKSILLISQLEKGKSFDESTRLPDSELESWAIQTASIKNFSEIKNQLSIMPTKETKASTLYRLWRYTFIPTWIEHMHGKKLKPFRCLIKNEISLAAAADKAGDRLWDSSDDRFLTGFIESCSE